MKYNVIGFVKSKNNDPVPLFNIPMMSDGRWNELAKEQAVHNYIRENGTEPEDIEEALQWQRKFIASLQTS